MTTGFHFSQFVYRADDGDMTQEQASDLLAAWLGLCEERGLQSGGRVLPVDDHGDKVSGKHYLVLAISQEPGEVRF